MSEEEKNATEELESIANGAVPPELAMVEAKVLVNLIEKQQKLINIFISNEAVKEGKDFNEIKEKYYECL